MWHNIETSLRDRRRASVSITNKIKINQDKIGLHRSILQIILFSHIHYQ